MAGRIKVLCVFGTRPEAIKMAPVIRELRRHPGRIDTRVCVTAQHRQMLDQMLALFEIQPDYDLDLMREDQSLTDVTAAVLTRLEPILAKETPDWMLVQGDTTTAMSAALGAFYHAVKIGHVEAGLRSGNKRHPFPEEVNRKIVDTVCDLHFAPTERARQNLVGEGIDPCSIRVTGNTVIDALHWVAGRPATPPAWLPPPPTRVVLVTAHRHENFGPPLEAICNALADIARRYRGEVHIVYSVHLNPNVRGPVHRVLGGAENVSLVPPLDYPDLVAVLSRAHLVVTDSGGLQEEAPAFGKPVLVLREVTERPEGVEAGMARIVGTNPDRVAGEVVRLLDSPTEYAQMARAVQPYGDGRAAERIVQALLA
ncbi:MAG TPA: UDP-N-acetylglucosamine 2-epimerase (non-hydrolyzing) [Candidatus Methylomirabilis sp.]|nr:UDP-N-acetylglucosamine 2-epimerase (non-hydrolyzing) [Candidatus Methylomirabilis sp.]